MTEGKPTDLRSLGEMLRAAREAQGRSVEQLSTATRISPRMLEALEADALERLGTPVYAKGFVRTVARELRLDERALVLKLEAQLATGRAGDSGVGGRGATWRYDQVKVVRPVAAGRRRPAPWQLLVAIVLLLLAVLGGVWLGRRGGAQERARTPAEAERPPESQVAPATVGGTDAAPTEAPTEASTPIAPPASAPAPAIPPPSNPAPTPLTAQTTGSAAQQEVVVFPQRSGLASIERSGAEPAPARLHFLDLRATGHVEIVVRTDGGEPQRRVLDAGQSWKLSARDFFTLRVSDVTVCEVWMDGARQRAPGSSLEFRLPPQSTP